jgi:hypothetical protein
MPLIDRGQVFDFKPTKATRLTSSVGSIHTLIYRGNFFHLTLAHPLRVKLPRAINWRYCLSSGEMGQLHKPAHS